MISLHQGEETEPMLPNTNATVVVDLADEKSAGGKQGEDTFGASQQQQRAYYYPSAASSGKNRKLGALKQLVIAIALMMMGASTLRLFQRYSKHRGHHSHRHHFGAGGNSRLDSGFAVVTSPEKAGWRSGSSSTHAGGRMPMPPFLPFMHPPRPTECYVLPSSSSDDAVHFNLTVPDFSHSVFMDFSLKDAKVGIESDAISPKKDGEEDDDDKSATMRFFEDKKEGGERGPKHDRKDGPPSPPPCHGRKMTDILVIAKSLSAKEGKESLTKDKNETYICVLDLPFGQMGLGLFHGKPSIKGPHHHHEDKDVLAAGPPPPFEKRHLRHQEPFEPVSVKLRFPPGPYTVTSQPPLPPHIGSCPPHSPHHHHHHHPKHPKKDSLKKKLLRFLKSFQHKSEEKKQQQQDHHHSKSAAKIPAAQDVKAAETILP